MDHGDLAVGETSSPGSPNAEVRTVEPVRPTVAPAVADALDEIVTPLDDDRRAAS
jgi:hypothetical protein